MTLGAKGASSGVQSMLGSLPEDIEKAGEQGRTERYCYHYAAVHCSESDLLTTVLNTLHICTCGEEWTAIGTEPYVLLCMTRTRDIDA